MRDYDNVVQLAMGTLSLLVGLGVGGLMLTQPEGLSPNWPIWIAMLAPSMFVLFGLHLLGTGLGYPRIGMLTVRALLVCMWGMLHWYTFFTETMQCTAGLSFLGFEILRNAPGERVCRAVLVAIVLTIDAVILLPWAVFAWRSRRGLR
jgi:hypothetical protein